MQRQKIGSQQYKEILYKLLTGGSV